MDGDVPIPRLNQLKTHAEKAITLWHLAQQTGQHPDPRHRDWWMGYREAIRDMQTGSAPWPAEFGLDTKAKDEPGTIQTR